MASPDQPTEPKVTTAVDPAEIALPQVDDALWGTDTTWAQYDSQTEEEKRKGDIDAENIRERVSIPLEFTQKNLWINLPSTSTPAKSSTGPQDGTPNFHFPSGLMEHAQKTFKNSFSDSAQLSSIQLPSGYSLPKSGKRVRIVKSGEGGPVEPSITLQCPHDASPDVLDAFVRKLAVDQEADVLVLDATEMALGEDGPLGKQFSEILQKMFDNNDDVEEDYGYEEDEGNDEAGEHNIEEEDEDKLAYHTRQIKRYVRALVDAEASPTISFPNSEPSDPGNEGGDISASGPAPPVSANHRRIIYLRDFGGTANYMWSFLGYLVEAVKSRRLDSLIAPLGPPREAPKLALPKEGVKDDSEGEAKVETMDDIPPMPVDLSTLSRVVIVYGVSKDPQTAPIYCCGEQRRHYPSQFDKAFESGDLADLQLILPHIGVPIYPSDQRATAHLLHSLINQHEGEIGEYWSRIASGPEFAFYGTVIVVFFDGVTIDGVTIDGVTIDGQPGDEWWQKSRKAAKIRRCVVLNDMRLRAELHSAGGRLVSEQKHSLEHLLADIPILAAMDSGDIAAIVSIADEHKAWDDTKKKNVIPFSSAADFLHRIVPSDVAQRMAAGAVKATPEPSEPEDAETKDIVPTKEDNLKNTQKENPLVTVSAEIIAQVHKDSFLFLAERKKWLKAQKALRDKSGGKEDPIITKVKAMQLSYHEQSLMPGVIDTSVISTTFEDVCVDEAIIDSIRTIVTLPLLYPSAFSSGILGKEAMSGILLYGPPGTGKTMLCRAIAKECKVRMLQVAPSSVNNMWVGETEKLVKAVFTLARKLAPCVIFIDELDAIFGGRGSFNHSVHRSMLTEFMQEMDGLRTAGENKEKGIIVIGCTNRPFDLDDAILRRLPRRVLVDLPGQKHREQILGVHLRGEILEGINIPEIAWRAEHYSGSDLKNLCVSAALASLKDVLPAKWTLISEENEGDEDGILGSGNLKLELGPRTIKLEHFEHAFTQVTASSTSEMESVQELRAWESTFASGARSARSNRPMPSAPPAQMPFSPPLDIKDEHAGLMLDADFLAAIEVSRLNSSHSIASSTESGSLDRGWVSRAFVTSVVGADYGVIRRTLFPLAAAFLRIFGIGSR